MRIAMLTCILICAHIGFTFSQKQLIPYRKGAIWGFVNAEKKWVIRPKYEWAAPFYHERARVLKGGKFGYINEHGKAVTPFEFDEAEDFRASVVEVRKGDKQYTINRDGQPARGGGCATGGRATFFSTFQEGEKIGLLVNERPCPDRRALCADTLPGRYEAMRENSRGLAAVLRDGKWGMVNTQGEVVVPFEYDNIEPQAGIYLNDNSSCSRVTQRGLVGFLDGCGNVIIPPKYEQANFFEKNLSLVKPVGRREGYVDMKGVEYFEE